MNKYHNKLMSDKYNRMLQNKFKNSQKIVYSHSPQINTQINKSNLEKNNILPENNNKNIIQEPTANLSKKYNIIKKGIILTKGTIM